MRDSADEQLKLIGCIRITDVSIVALARSCPLLIELNISKCVQLGNAAVYSVLLNAAHIRDLVIIGNTNINDDAFPNLPHLYDLDNYELALEAKGAPIYTTTASLTDESQDAEAIPRTIRPEMDRLDLLREVDLTSCTGIGDRAIANLIASAPKLRCLKVAKCSEITDAGVDSICNLGKSLHHLHLGHVSK